MTKSENSKKPERSFNDLMAFLGFRTWIVITADCLAIGFNALLFLIMWNIKDNFYQNLLVCIIGWLCGWGLGIFITPYNKKESQQFVSIGQTVSVFISGYVVSKLDRFLEKALFSTDTGIVATGWEKLGLFTASLICMTLVIFINRTYLYTPRTKARQTTTITENKEIEIPTT